MIWTDLNRYILNNYENASILFDLENCYLEESVIIDQLDNLDQKDKIQASYDYEQMGFKIDNNNVIVPARLPFLIKRSSGADPTSYYIVRKGIEVGISWPDELDVHIDLSDIGKKCMLVGKTLDITADYEGMYEAYDHIKAIENIFGVTIIK